MTAITQGEKHDVNHHVNCNINPAEPLLYEYPYRDKGNHIEATPTGEHNPPLLPLQRLAEVPNNANEGIKELCKEKLS
jgi:hypothetical protein